MGHNIIIIRIPYHRSFHHHHITLPSHMHNMHISLVYNIIRPSHLLSLISSEEKEKGIKMYYDYYECRKP